MEPAGNASFYTIKDDMTLVLKPAFKQFGIHSCGTASENVQLINMEKEQLVAQWILSLSSSLIKPHLASSSLI